MKNFIQFIFRIFHREASAENSIFESIDHETGIKLLQYFMLCVLLILCFILPGADVKKRAKESAQQRVQQELRESSPGGNADASADSGLKTGIGAGNGNTEAGNGAGNGTSGAGAKNGDENENSGSGEGESSGAGSMAGQKGTIVIDAGHGGDDPGMIGPSGINEKVLNLIYAEKLKELLEAQGYRIVMTRETEDGLYDEDQSNKKAQDMERRVKIIEENSPLLTVSIHQNSYPDASVSGPQVFYFQHSVEAEKLAASIQNAMNTELEIGRPRTHKGNTSYYILKRSSSVTVIVECGFLTNPQEEEKLQEEEYQNQVAQAICDGVLAYLEKASQV